MMTFQYFILINIRNTNLPHSFKVCVGFQVDDFSNCMNLDRALGVSWTLPSTDATGPLHGVGQGVDWFCSVMQVPMKRREISRHLVVSPSLR